MPLDDQKKPQRHSEAATMLISCDADHPVVTGATGATSASSSSTGTGTAAAAASAFGDHPPAYPTQANNTSRCSTRGRTLVSQVTVGSYLSIYWPLDDTYYHACVVGAAKCADTSSSTTTACAGMFTVTYTDGSVETLNLRQEKFRLLDDETEFVKEQERTRQRERDAPSSGRRTAANRGGVGGLVVLVDRKVAPSSDGGTNHTNQQVGSRYDANVPKFSATSRELSDDCYLLVLSCLTSLKDVSALARTCRRIHSLWKNIMHREKLLQSLFRSRFGSEANACTFGGVLGGTKRWQDVWKDMVNLKQALMLQEEPAFAREGFNKRTKEQMCQLIRTFTGGGDDSGDGTVEVDNDKKPSASSAGRTTGTKRKRSKADRLRRTLGVLSEREEAEAIFYDNPSYAPEPSAARYCFGYFGMTALNISLPIAAGAAAAMEEENNGPAVAVWGDFLGVRIFHSPEDVLHDPDTIPTSGRRRGGKSSRRFETIASENGEGLVLSTLVCPFADELTAIDVEDNMLRPVLFLGMSSGVVISVGAGAGADGKASFGIISSEEAHESEVTSLTVVKNPGKIGIVDEPESFMLASGSVDKKIRIYRLAFVADAEYSLRQNHTACTSECLMFCLAATTVQLPSLHTALIGAGDDNGFISFYASNDDSSFYNASENDESNCNGFSFYSAGRSKFSQREQIKPTRIKFLDGDILVAGSTHGDVKVLRLRVREDFNRSSKIQASTVTLHRMSSAHVGTIEQIERFGDVLVTSGGFDGQLKGWNFKTGRLLGTILCHKGCSSVPETASMQPNRSLYSSVVGAVLFDDNTNQKSLLCLCRDGTLFRWEYMKDIEKYKSGLDKDTTIGDGATADDWLVSLLRPAAKSAKVTGSKKKQKIRTLAELKHVMTKPGRAGSELQQKMRLEIFKSAVSVALQSDHKDAPFLGADGKIYESTKRAFSKYSGLEACASCRSRSQGAFLCRLIKVHELPAASLAEVKALLKTEVQRKPAQDTASSLSVLECIEKSKSPQKKLAGEPEEIEDEWQCHRCMTINDTDDKKCTSCWASKAMVVAFPSSRSRRKGA